MRWYSKCLEADWYSGLSNSIDIIMVIVSTPIDTIVNVAIILSMVLLH